MEAQNLLISYIAVDASLLATQTQKEIAMQQQAQYQQQALAEEQRIAVQEKTARANMQPEVVKAALQVEINANNAKAAVKQAEGVRDSTMIKADGDAAAIRTGRRGPGGRVPCPGRCHRLGPGRAREGDGAGRGREDQDHPGHAPDVDDGRPSGAAGLFSAYLATLLNQKSTNPSKQYVSREEDDFRSALNAARAPGEPTCAASQG